MQIEKNNIINETFYTETLENGMKVVIVKKHNTDKKYIIWGTKFGSIDNEFIDPRNGEKVKVPDGVAHYLEHKMFEQKSGVDSLYTLMALGLDANAYTTKDHTAYLFGGIDNFYKGLDELMDYVQNPYYTDENVEKERGIIGQEIQIYQDTPFDRLYQDALNCIYKNNTVKIDIAGSIESISKITKETLYSCYYTFYNPSNMIMCVVGDFEPKELLEEIRKRLLKSQRINEIKRIYPEEPQEINQKFSERTMEINMPIFMIGFKDTLLKENKVKEQVAIDIILNSLFGKCSNCYQEMYNKGLLFSEMSLDFENSIEFSHVLISGMSKSPKEINEIVTETLKNKKIEQDEFERSKKRLFGEFIMQFDDVEEIGRNVLPDLIRNVNTLDYTKIFENIDIEYVNYIKDKLFSEENQTLSIVKGKNSK